MNINSFVKTGLKVLFIYIGILSICGCGYINKNDPAVMNGYIDISSWSFNADQGIKLEGEWKYKFNQMTYIGKDFNDETWDKLKVPGYWNNRENNSFGYCILKLRIKNNIHERLNLYIEYANTSYELYVNGILLLKNGMIGQNSIESVSQNIPCSAELPRTEFIDITWIIVNFSDIYGGATNPPVINTSEQMKYSLWTHTLIDSSQLGMIFIIFVYNFILWMGRKNDKKILYLSIFSLLIFLRLFAIDNIFESLFPNIGLFEIRKKIEYITMGLGWSVFSLYIYNLFPMESEKIFILFFKYSGLLLSLVALITPVNFYTQFLIIYQIVIVLSILNLILILSLARTRNREGSIIILIGAFFLFITVINDILVANKVINNINLISSGVILFVLIQSILISNLFTKAFSTAEHLSQNLQDEVATRTRELEQAKDMIEEQGKARTTFFINLAHEIKTPLTLIKNYFDRYLKINLRNIIPDDLKIIKYQLEHFSNDIVNLLDSENIERGEIIYKHDRILNITEILPARIKLFKEGIKNIQINFTFAGRENLYTRMNPYAFDRVFNNILDNAVKYTKDEINITLKSEHANIIITIADNGTGIPPELSKKIFNPYYQISREKSNFQGLGMGLYIVKSIIDSVNGCIEIGNNPDKGLEVTIALLKCEFAKDDLYTEVKGYIPKMIIEKEIEPVLLKEVYKKERATIFYIEDNKELVSLLQKTMYDEFNFYYALNGQEALRKIKLIYKPDIIISDIMMNRQYPKSPVFPIVDACTQNLEYMPEKEVKETMGGHEFHANIIKDENFSDIPFLFLTARTIEHEKIESLAKGAIDYIYKPFDMQELLEKVRSLIKTRKAHIERMKRKLACVLDTEEDQKALNFERICEKYGITRKEKEIIIDLSKGLQNKEIAARQNLSKNTINKHVRSIYKKCKVQNRVELMNRINETM